MRYVTFHYDLMIDSISDFKIHADKETALKYFNYSCKNYFQIKTNFKANKFPASYGYPLRKVYGMSARSFKKLFNISIDEAMEIEQGRK